MVLDFSLQPWMPTEEQAFDFFTRNWDPEPEPEPDKPVETPKAPESVKSGETAERRSLPKGPEEGEEEEGGGERETPPEGEEEEVRYREYVHWIWTVVVL